MTDDSPAITASGLTKTFDADPVVDGIDLAIEPGTVYGFLGPNGAGKTTTMRMLTTLTAPTSGDAAIMGTPVADRDGVRDHVGYLPEEPPVFDELTGREQLRYFARLRDLPPAPTGDRIDRWIDRFDLAADADRRLDDYSKGMRQKIGLIQALLHEPAVVFLDEPTSGLDPRAARTVLDAIDDLTDNGQTVFLSTHILSVVEELADTVGVLYDGRIVAEGAPDDLTETAESGADSTLEDVFLSVTTESPTSRDESPTARDESAGSGDESTGSADESTATADPAESVER